MTELHHRTSSVRRTVTIAVALVVGQLALCSVIGWITFGDLVEGTPRRDPGSVPVMAEAPPEPVAVPVPSPSAAAAPRATSWAPRTTASTRAAAPRTRRPIAPATSASGVAEPTVSPTDPVLLPAPADEEAVQEPVERHELCSPEDALGRTKDGDRLRCRQSDDGQLRWRVA